MVPVRVGRLLDAKLQSGEVRPQTRGELRQMTGELCRSCAVARIERLVNQRDYSAEELRRKLRLDGYAQTTVDACVERAQETHLVDDGRYAEVFVRTKVASGWGISRIERELSNRGIKVEDISGWPYDFLDPEEEFDRAVEVASRRRVREPHAYEKLVRFLSGRGFAGSVAHGAARTVLAQRIEA